MAADEQTCIVVGGGIGGLSAAIALSQTGLFAQIRVLELADHPSARSGAVSGGIGLAPNGLRALRAIGGDRLLNAVLAASWRSPDGMIFQRHTDASVVAAVPLGDPAPAAGGDAGGDADLDAGYIASTAEVPCVGGGTANVRRDAVLLALLAAAERDTTIDVVYGVRVEGVDEHPEGDSEHVVGVVLHGGETMHAALVVAADGVHSAVRAALLGPHAGQARYTGFISVGGVAGKTAGDGDDGVLGRERTAIHFVLGDVGQAGYAYMGPAPGVAAAATQLDAEDVGENRWMWWTHLPHDEPLSRDELAALPLGQLLADRFGHWAPPLSTFACEHEASILRTPIYDVPSLPTWHRGRIVLLGDAAHAMSPAGGQGAAMAIEDAVVLARALHRARLPRLSDALARYELLRRARVEPIVAQGHANDRRSYGGTRKSWLGQLFRNTLIWAISGVIARSLRNVAYGLDPDPLDPGSF